MAKATAERKTFDLNFAGLPFKLRSSHDAAMVQELAEFVDQKLQQALAATKSGSYQSAAVLAALNIAEELILLKRKALVELERVEAQAQRLSRALENSKIPSQDTTTHS